MRTSRKALGSLVAGVIVVAPAMILNGPVIADGAPEKVAVEVAKPRPIDAGTMVEGEEGVRGLARPTPERRGGRRGWDPRDMRPAITGAFQSELRVDQATWVEAEPLIWTLVEERLGDWRLLMPFRPLREADMTPAMRALYDALDAGDLAPEKLDALMKECRSEHQAATTARQAAVARLREILTAEQQAWLTVRRILELAD